VECPVDGLLPDEGLDLLGLLALELGLLALLVLLLKTGCYPIG